MYKKVDEKCTYCGRRDQMFMVTYGYCKTIYTECENCWSVNGQIPE